MFLFRERLYFCILEDSLLMLSYWIPEAVLRHSPPGGGFYSSPRQVLTLTTYTEKAHCATALSEDLRRGLYQLVPI